MINPKLKQRIKEGYEMAGRRKIFYGDDPEKRKYYEGMQTAFSMMALWLDVEDIMERRDADADQLEIPGYRD